MKAKVVAAFSLVEVVVALGLVAFALVAIIGVLPIGLATSRKASQETRANHLADEVFSTLRSQPFTNVNLSTLALTATIDLSSQNGALNAPLYATYDGQFVSSPDYFTIQLEFRTPPDGLETGTASEVRVHITGREESAVKMDYISIVGVH